MIKTSAMDTATQAYSEWLERVLVTALLKEYDGVDVYTDHSYEIVDGELDFGDPFKAVMWREEPPLVHPSNVLERYDFRFYDRDRLLDCADVSMTEKDK